MARAAVANRATVIVKQNLLKYSEQFDQSSAWTLNAGATLSANAGVAPDGNTTADKCIPPASIASTRGFQQLLSTISGQITVSVYAKAAGFSWVSFYDVGNNARKAWFDVTNGVVGTVVAGFYATIESVGNGWYRCSMIQIAPVVAGSTNYFQLVISDADNSGTSTGNGSNGMLFWGAQVVQANWAGAYTLTTTAVVNSGNIRNKIPVNQNFFTQSQTFDNAAWSKTNCSISADAILAPDNTMTADGILASSTSSVAHSVVQGDSADNASVNLGNWDTVSFYVKAGAVGFCSILSDGSFADYTFILSGNGSIGASGAAETGLFPRIEPASITMPGAPAGWYRIWLSTIRRHSGNNMRISPLSTNTATLAYAAADTITPQIYIWGAQHTLANWPGAYTPTTTAVVNTGAVRNIVPKNQNLITQSETFDNAAWSKTNATITANTTDTLDPLGGNTADIILEDTTNGTHSVFNTPAASDFVIGRQYTISCYVKAGTRSQAFLQSDSASFFSYFDLTTGVASGTSNFTSTNSVNIGNGWWRLSITFTAISTGRSLVMPSVGGSAIYIGTTSAKAIYIWGFQVVQANWAGQYVATTTLAYNLGNIRNLVSLT